MEMDKFEIRRYLCDDADQNLKTEAICIQCGNDLIVVVCGGERYHIGAAALTISIPSIKDPHKLTNSSYLLSVPGHKEEQLAREGSYRLSKRLNRNVIVIVGIHKDQATLEEIGKFFEKFDELIEKVSLAYSPESGSV